MTLFRYVSDQRSFVPSTVPSARSRRAAQPLHPCAAAGGPGSPGAGDEPPAVATKLSAIIKRKQQQVGQLLKDLGEEDLQARLEAATESPARPAHRLAALLEHTIPLGRPALVLEACRSDAVPSSQALGELAARLVAAGADAISVRTDSEDTPTGLADLFAVCRSVPATPILQRDWFIHPIQVVDAKEAGAAGIIGTIASVSGRGTPLMSSFAAGIGLDCPVEVVNMQELKAMESVGVPFFGINLSVGLSVRVAGFGTDVARGLLEDMPFGAVSLVGVTSVEEARRMRLAGADALLVKRELVDEFMGREHELLQSLQMATCGDD